MAGLLRPPAHRGPLIAGGAVVLALGVALVEIRFEDEWGAGWHLALTGALAALYLWLGLQGPGEGGRPRAHESVLLVTGLLALLAALLRLADVLGAEELPAGTLTWLALLEGAAAAACAARRGSAICSYLAAVSLGTAFLAAAEWLFDLGPGTYRWLLALLALAFVTASLVLRGSRPRHSEMLVSAAGLSILAIPVQEIGRGLAGLLGLFGFGLEPELPGAWELVVLAAGCGLIAYAAADRAPGPGYVGFANLVLFLVLNGDGDTLEWWPLVLVVVGLLALLAGLRPVRPLPPEPEAYSAHDLPPSVRATDEGVTLRVRGD